MFFGLSNISISFQEYIKKILAKKLNIFFMVNFDHIFIYTKNPEQVHVDVVRWLVDILRKHRFYANLKKCYFDKDEVHFLYYIVLAKVIQIEDEKLRQSKIGPKPN